MKILRFSSRILIGLVFIFSGTVKAIDPLGSAYKFHDYFQAFHLGFLNELSLILSVLLCTTEFIAGFSVLTGIWQKAGYLAGLSADDYLHSAHSGSCNYKSGLRLRMLWRCHSSDKLADILART